MVVACALAAGGCGGGGSADDTPLTVYAAASLRDVFPTIDSSARYSFGGSDQLATQIREGAPADVYAAASAKHARELLAEGLVEQPVTFASNRLVLIVPAANPADILDIADVARAGVRLVVAGEGVPVGDYTRTALENLGLTPALRNVVSNEKDVAGVVGKVALGEADAGFAYVTDAAAAGDAVTAVAVPADAQPPIAYQVAVVSASDRKDAARAFVAKLTGPAGRAVLTSAGFAVP